MALSEWVIWWTTGFDVVALFQREEDRTSAWMTALPEYIQDLFYSRAGRNGRGRLWTPDDCPVTEIEWQYGKMGARYAENAGGLVVRIQDAPLLQRYPGIVTTLALDLL